MKVRMIVACLVLVALVGCYSTTPEGTKVLTPEAVAHIDTGIETLEGAASVAAGASLLWPGASAIAAALLAIAGTVKRLKPKIVDAETSAEISSNMVFEIVTAIENYKLNSPEGWENLGKVFKANFSDYTRSEVKKIINN